LWEGDFGERMRVQGEKRLSGGLARRVVEFGSEKVKRKRKKGNHVRKDRVLFAGIQEPVSRKGSARGGGSNYKEG